MRRVDPGDDGRPRMLRFEPPSIAVRFGAGGSPASQVEAVPHGPTTTDAARSARGGKSGVGTIPAGATGRRSASTDSNGRIAAAAKAAARFASPDARLRLGMAKHEARRNRRR